MSHAFVREGDEQWLHDIDPTMAALINYLTRENNGIRVYEKETYMHPKMNKEAHVMSNGMTYIVNDNSQWEIVD